MTTNETGIGLSHLMAVYRSLDSVDGPRLDRHLRTFVHLLDFNFAKLNTGCL